MIGETLRLESKPPTPGPRDEVRRLCANEEIHCLILSRKYWGVWTHWQDGRSAPCFADKSKCPGCQVEAPSRWKGYIHVWDNSRKRDCFLELTPTTAEAIDKNFPEGTDLRGIVLSIRRGKGNKARLEVVVQYGRQDPSQIPVEKDPAPTLLALWGMPDRRRRFDAVNARRIGVDLND